MKSSTCFVGFLVLAGACDPAGRAPLSIDIEISNAYIVEPALPERTAMYFSVANGGDLDDELLAVATEVATGEIHRTVANGDVMKMERVETARVPAGGELVMRPGSHHVMLLDLSRELRAGDRVNAVLRFKHAGAIEVRAEVVSYADLEAALGADRRDRRR
ncbi:MAG: copper chaperone PCu(A)C [Gemmatimonadota bacterium]|nr:MAG: copper chaperone PCu(A)C [Gemmatimonadota bacterium]